MKAYCFFETLLTFLHHFSFDREFCLFEITDSLFTSKENRIEIEDFHHQMFIQVN